jgi:hypothetical protein
MLCRLEIFGIYQLCLGIGKNTTFVDNTTMISSCQISELGEMV